MKSRRTLIGLLAVLAAFLVSAAPAAAKPATATLYYGSTTYPVSVGNCPADYPGADVNQAPSRGDPSGKMTINVSGGTGSVSISHATVDAEYHIYLYNVNDCGITGTPWDTYYGYFHTDKNGRGSARFNFSGLSSGDTVIAEAYSGSTDWFATLRFQL